MKWCLQALAVLALATCVGCNSNSKEIAPADTGEAPSAEKMKSAMEESMKNMPKADPQNPNAGKMDEMMKKAMESAPK